MSSAQRSLYIFLGSASVGLAFLGVVTPLLPTTPFLLLASICFAKSSPKLNEWLLKNKYFGKSLQRYLNGEKMPLRSKLYVGIMICFSLTISFISLN